MRQSQGAAQSWRGDWQRCCHVTVLHPRAHDRAPSLPTHAAVPSRSTGLPPVPAMLPNSPFHVPSVSRLHRRPCWDSERRSRRHTNARLHAASSARGSLASSRLRPQTAHLTRSLCLSALSLCTSSLSDPRPRAARPQPWMAPLSSGTRSPGDTGPTRVSHSPPLPLFLCCSVCHRGEMPVAPFPPRPFGDAVGDTGTLGLSGHHRCPCPELSIL